MVKLKKLSFNLILLTKQVGDNSDRICKVHGEMERLRRGVDNT